MNKFIETLAIFNGSDLGGKYEPKDLEPLVFDLLKVVSFNRVSPLGFTTITLEGSDSYYVAIEYDTLVKLIRKEYNTIQAVVSEKAIKEYQEQ